MALHSLTPALGDRIGSSGVLRQVHLADTTLILDGQRRRLHLESEPKGLDGLFNLENDLL